MKYKLNKEHLVEIFSTVTFGSDWLEIKYQKEFNDLVKECSVCMEEKWADILLAGGYLEAFIHDYVDPLRITFSFVEMEYGFKKFLSECPQEYEDLVNGNVDYYTLSYLMQVVLLGEVVFR